MKKSVFKEKLYEKIVNAMKICEEGNVIDMRLYVDDESCCKGIYSIFEVDELFETASTYKTWYIDFFENVAGVNIAHFMDIALFSTDIPRYGLVEWEEDSKDAVILWKQPFEKVKVLITSRFVKFFRSDNDSLTCYTYPSLDSMKKDKYFIQCITETLMESNQYDKTEFDNWLNSTCELPPFPISVIFHSDYSDYTCKCYDE